MSKLPDKQFGINWAKIPNGDRISLIERHWQCAYRNVGLGSYYHRKEIITALWPDYVWHEWNERRLRAWCESDWTIWVGPGGCGKTNDAAILALVYWLEAPHQTAVIVCSTSVKMLKKRIWAQVAHWHQKLPQGLGPVGELIDSDTLIRWKKGDVKNGIFGLAVEEGSPEEVINNLIGIHTHRVCLILDEMQGVKEVIMKATRNMGKNPNFKFHGMGNPESKLDTLGRAAEPINGWESVVDRVTPTWEIHPGPARSKGRCDFFCGTESPAYKDPEFAKANPWMINREQIEADLRAVRGNENDPGYQSQSIGWWPSMGIDSTVLDEAILIKFKCRSKAVWTHGFRRAASLDPAFEGGDKKILRFFKFGEVQDDEGKRWTIEFGEWIDVPIDAESAEPIHYQIANYCIAECRRRNIPAEDFALDSTGEGGGLHSIFLQLWGPVVGVEFGGKPSDRPVGNGTTKICSEEYNNRATELNMAVRQFALANGIRGLDDKAAVQFCARKTRFHNKKYRVEPKRGSKGGEKGFRDRMGYSPDHADSCAIAVELAIQRGASPASVEISEKQSAPNEDYLRSVTDEYSEDNYLAGYDAS